VNGTAWAIGRAGDLGRRVQSGQLQTYGAVAFTGLAVMLVVYVAAVDP
jgi:NADH-quinone oxidoreductase subunit L